MKKVHSTSKNRRNIRSRRNIQGEAQKPRICVYRSNTHIYVQAIDDRNNKVLANSSSLKIEKGTKSDKSKEVGIALGDKLNGLNINHAVFDRNGYKYHGRIKALVEGIRSKGINF